MSLTRSRERKDYKSLYMEAITCLVTAYPEGAFREVAEDVYVLRIGSGNYRRKKTWTPYSIAIEEGDAKVIKLFLRCTARLSRLISSFNSINLS
jgi:hypothetical protein